MCVWGSVFTVFVCGLGAEVCYVFLWVVFLHISSFSSPSFVIVATFSCILFIIFFYTCHMLLLLCKAHCNEMCHINKSALPCPFWVLSATLIIIKSCHNHTVSDSLLRQIIFYSLDSKKKKNLPYFIPACSKLAEIIQQLLYLISEQLCGFVNFIQAQFENQSSMK